MLSVVCWRWGTRYGVEFVTRLASMLRRHLHVDYELVCVTDDPAGLDGSVRVVPMPNPRGLGRARRLQMFDPEFERVIAPSGRLLQFDVDCVIVNDITPLVDRREPLVVWKTPPGTKYKPSIGQIVPNADDPCKGPFNTSMVLRDVGTFPTLWADYCASQAKLERDAKLAGLWTIIWTAQKREEDGALLHQGGEYIADGDDDQAVFSLYAKPLNPPQWTEADGVYKWGRRGFADKLSLPGNARIVFFNGSMENQRIGSARWEPVSWVEAHWR